MKYTVYITAKMTRDFTVVVDAQSEFEAEENATGELIDRLSLKDFVGEDIDLCVEDVEWDEDDDEDWTPRSM